MPELHIHETSRRRLFLGAAATVGVLTFVRGASAFDPKSKAAINVDANGVAMRGYDPVSYQTGAQPVMGSDKFTAAAGGTIYHFASAANRDAFRANPARYEPVYGGFCAMSVALDRKANSDPTVYRVIGDHLYLYGNDDLKKRFTQDSAANEKKAQSNWPKVKNAAPYVEGKGQG